jgi:hypothetical protein
MRASIARAIGHKETQMTGSSPEATASAQAEPQVSDASTPEVSSAAETQGEMSLIETVQAALEKGAKETSPGSEPEAETAASTTAETPATPEDEPLGEITDEELKRYAPKTQRRIQQLLQERHGWEEKATAASEKASRFDQIVGFAEANRLSNEDVAATFEIAALMKNEPEKAYEKVLPIFLHLSRLTGNVLPADIQEKVNLGYLPEQDARELVRLKTQTALEQARSTERAEREQAAQAVQAQRQIVSDCTDATAEWESKRSAGDPDWSSKKDMVLRVVRAEIAEKGFPQNKANMVALLNSAAAEVDQQVSRFRPAPRAVTPATGTSSARASAEPTSAVEAAMMALGGAR